MGLNVTLTLGNDNTVWGNTEETDYAPAQTISLFLCLDVTVILLWGLIGHI